MQDGADLHEGKKNSRYNTLMHQFFQHAISNACKENTEKAEDYKILQNILDDYF